MKSAASMAGGDHFFKANNKKNSHAFPFVNTVFYTFFFSVICYLFIRLRQKIHTATPLHLTLSEMAAVVCLVASFIYFLGFFGMNFHPFPEEEEEEEEFEETNMNETLHSTIAGDCSEDDEKVIQAVVDGETPSYSLESKLRDCKRAAFIRRQALERITGKSLEGLPLEGFNYESILGQCCEMPVGYVQIPVGIAGPLSLDGTELWVPMATTEGCLVASTNRGCKAINASGGATSVLLKDGMTRAPVVRFSTAKRAADLKFFLEEPLNFQTLASVFNRLITALLFRPVPDNLEALGER